MNPIIFKATIPVAKPTHNCRTWFPHNIFKNIVWEEKLQTFVVVDDNSKTVAAKILEIFGDDEFTYTSAKYKTGASKADATNAIQRLRRKGKIEIVKVLAVGKHRTNVYRFIK